MDSIIRRALTGSPEHPTLTFERTYRASTAEVRSACTSPERLARWLGKVEGAPSAVGDAYTAILGGGIEDAATGRVLRCDDEVIAVSWTWQGERESVITLRITPVDAQRTTLTLRHALGEPDHAADYGGGWEQLLQALARTLGIDAGDAASDRALEAAARETWRAALHRPLRLERVVPAPVSRVWEMFATAEGLKAWWWRHWNDVEIVADVREGGHYRIVAAGAGIELSGAYLTVDPHRRLAYTWCWRDDEGGAPDEAVEIRFDEVPDGTRIIVQHTGPWADDAPAESYRQGWAFTLDQLAENVSGRTS